MVKSELVHKLCDMHVNILRRDMVKIVEIITSEIVEAPALAIIKCAFEKMVPIS